MQRLFGMMPSRCVEILKSYKTKSGTITIQAGKEGYSILYSDGSSEYKDIDNTAEGNFKTALNIIINHFPELTNAQPLRSYHTI